jgi:hypothetical protein
MRLRKAYIGVHFGLINKQKGKNFDHTATKYLSDRGYLNYMMSCSMGYIAKSGRFRRRTRRHYANNAKRR